MGNTNLVYTVQTVNKGAAGQAKKRRTTMGVDIEGFTLSRLCMCCSTPMLALGTVVATE